jgi:hypothetical protein
MKFLKTIEEMIGKTIIDVKTSDYDAAAAITFDDGTAIFIEASTGYENSVELDVSQPTIYEQKKYGWMQKGKPQEEQ